MEHISPMVPQEAPGVLYESEVKMPTNYDDLYMKLTGRKMDSSQSNRGKLLWEYLVNVFKSQGKICFLN